MKVLTPKGYVPTGELTPGDTVVSACSRTGRRVLNTVKAIELVNTDEWQRWHNWQATPDFCSYRINDDFTLFGEQSVFCDDGKVTHAKLLKAGRRIFFRGKPVTVKRVRRIDAAPWHRLEIDGDHTFIGDGLSLHNASRFWVGGTGTWDLSATGHWAATSGGASGASAPGSADTATFDGSSGGGTVTPSYGGTGTFQSITCGAFTGTITWATNNESVTLSAATGFAANGTGTRTLNLGNGTWTLSATGSGTLLNTTGSNLTFNANSSTISWSGAATALQSFSGGGKTFSTLSIGTCGTGGAKQITDANTFATMTMTTPTRVLFPASATTTITNAFTWNGTSTQQLLLTNNFLSGSATISVASGNPAITWAAITLLTFTGGATFAATNSFDCGSNSGITITAPSSGGGGFFGRHGQAQF